MKRDLLYSSARPGSSAGIASIFCWKMRRIKGSSRSDEGCSVEHQKLEQHIINFDKLTDYAHSIRAQDIFCCLGTTIKKAGSREAFRRVDFTCPHEIARIAAENGAEQMLLVSALGADAKSRVFYNRVKGETEDALSKLPFGGVQIFRPSLLLGERQEVRRGEQIAERVMNLFSFAFIGSLKKYLPVNAHGGLGDGSGGETMYAGQEHFRV